MEHRSCRSPFQRVDIDRRTVMTPAVSKSDNDDVCSTSDGCTSRQRSTWPRLHPSLTIDLVDTDDRQSPSRRYRDANSASQRQSTYNGGCPSRGSGTPRRREWVACVQRRRSSAAAAAAPTPSVPSQRRSASVSAAVLRRQKTVTSATDDVTVDTAQSGAVSSPSPAATTTGEAASDDDLDAENILNYETVLRCLDSCDKILLRHSTVIT